MEKRPGTALVIVGHGSTTNPDSSEPTHRMADLIRQRGIFDEVLCCFWKEEPSMREVLHSVTSPDVYVVPNFISEGYFTQEVIPRELGLEGRINYTFSNVLWNTPYSVTSRSFVNEHAEQDRILYAKYHNERILKHAKN